MRVRERERCENLKHVKFPLKLYECDRLHINWNVLGGRPLAWGRMPHKTVINKRYRVMVYVGLVYGL